MDIKTLFLNQFDPKIKNEVIEFGKRLTKINADVFIVMARKGACLIDCLQELNITTLEGYVTSERVLDLDTSWLENKKVVIIDDTIISGTTLYKTIKKLRLAKVKDISVNVLTVDKENFVPDLLYNENEKKSYLTKPFLSLNHTECIKVCSDIVNALSIYPRPYDIDFPYFNKINIVEDDFKHFIQHTNWSLENSTSFLQDRNDTFSYSFTPSTSIKEKFDFRIGAEISQFAMLKIRTYGIYKKKNKSTYKLRILPIVVLKPMSYASIDNLFKSITSIGEDIAFEQIDSYSSKLRLIQYFLASKLAEIWVESMSVIAKEKVVLDHDLFTLRLLFNAQIINPFAKILTKNTFPLFSNEVELENIDSIDDTLEFKSRHKVKDDSVETIHLLLIEPFLRLYYDKEIKAWEIVKKYGRKVFYQDEYIKIISRLDKGYSISFFTKLVQKIDEINPIKIVSTFLDKAIDIGIAVPIIVEDDINKVIYRAYRHGEDVPFGEKEEKLLAIVINAFSENLGRKELQHIWLEKLSVLLIKIGIQNKFLNPIISNVPQRDMICSKEHHTNAIVSIKTYLYGPVATYKEYGIEDPIETKPYLEPGQNDLWLTNVLLEKKIITKSKDTNLYSFNEYPKISLDEKLEGRAENIGLIFGQLLKDKLIDPKDDFVKLTACIYPQENLQSLAAEINIFSKKWIRFHSYLDRNIRHKNMHYSLADNIRKSNISFTAINSGQKKFEWFQEKAGQKLIEEIKTKLTPKYLKNLWAEYWSPNKDWTVDSIDKDLYNCIINQGLWLICMNTYLRILDYSLRNTAVTSSNTEYNRNNKKIENLFVEIKKYFEKLKPFKRNKRTREIIPFVEDIIKNRETHKESDYIVFTKVTLLKIKSLIYSSKLLLDDSELLVNKFGKIDNILRYSHALFIDIEESKFYFKKKIWNDILTTIDDYKQRLFDGGHESDLIIQLPDDKNILGRGIWLASNGSLKSNILSKLAHKILSLYSSKIKIKCTLYSQLPEEYRIKTAGDNNSTIKYGNFWSQVSHMKEIFVLDLQETSELSLLNTIIEDKPFLTPEFIKLNQLEQNQYEFKSENKISTEGVITNTYNHKIYNYMNKTESQSADIGIITIVSQETRAVLKQLDIEPTDDIIRNGKSFYEGHFESADKGVHKVALTQQLEQGNRSVIMAYNALVNNYNPKLIVVLGIAGCISKDMALCDVVIANQVLYYENRKETPDKTNRRGDVFKIEAKLKQYINKLFLIYDEPAILSASKESYKEKFKILAGPIGSGEAVIADNASEVKDWLVEVNSKTLALEMEAGGFLQAYYEDGLTDNQPSLGALVIRGISDHADAKKNDKWRKPASENAVKCLVELLKLIPRFS
jgi:nucleoside phosphorylase